MARQPAIKKWLHWWKLMHRAVVASTDPEIVAAKTHLIAMLFAVEDSLLFQDGQVQFRTSALGKNFRSRAFPIVDKKVAK